MGLSLIDQLPFWLSGLLFFGILLATLELGYLVGVWQHDKWKDAEDGGGGIILTSVFALLGLLLAFTFADGVSHYKARKQAVIAEANALGTAFLRADMVADPSRTELKQASLDYARTRAVESGRRYRPEEVQKIVEKSTQVLTNLWPATLKVLQQNPPGPIEASLVAAINEVIDYYTIRNMSVFDTLPITVILLLVFVTSAAVAVAGFNAGLSGA